jgi:hypothetical protein
MMAVERSVSLQRALEREAVRFCGSLAVVWFYDGARPSDCNGVADGQRVMQRKTDETMVRRLVSGGELEMPPGATYWRMTDANGNVVMQGGLDGVA